MKIMIVFALLAILTALFSGLYFLLKDGSQTKRTANALALRIALSVSLIVFLIMGYLLGWIQPHGLHG